MLSFHQNYINLISTSLAKSCATHGVNGFSRMFIVFDICLMFIEFEWDAFVWRLRSKENCLQVAACEQVCLTSNQLDDIIPLKCDLNIYKHVQCNTVSPICQKAVFQILSLHKDILVLLQTGVRKRPDQDWTRTKTIPRSGKTKSRIKTRPIPD